MQIPDAATALDHATRPRRARMHPEVHRRALAVVLASISRAVAARLTSTVVEVPIFVFGEPRVHVDDVTEYVRAVLEQRGYQIDTFVGVPSVAISWADQDACAHRCAPDKLSTNHRTPRPPPSTSSTSVSDYDIGL